MAATQELMLGEGAGNGVKNYIEDVFSTYLYTGTGASGQTITNNIDLSTKGGLVWTKCRSNLSTDHSLFDTSRGATNLLISNGSGAQTTVAQTLTAFNTSGFSLGSSNTTNQSGWLFSSWTFREQPKFFDVVTYTGTGANRTVSHNLGSVPGCIVVKRTSISGDWAVYHRSLANTEVVTLNTTTAKATSANTWNSTSPTSTEFTVGTNARVNESGQTYVAYIFAHDAGGFGLAGTDNVISCGSYTGNGASYPDINLGYEPQWLMVKRTDLSGNWVIFDVTRGMFNWLSTSGNLQSLGLCANLTDEEKSILNIYPTSTGFYIPDVTNDVNANGGNYVYVSIRKGPMKVPTDATKVFVPVAYTADNLDNRLITTGIVTDMALARVRNASSTNGAYFADRFRGLASLGSANTLDAEVGDADSFMTPTAGFGQTFSAMNGFGVGNDPTRLLNNSTNTEIAYGFQRAPSFFDVVCYKGTGSARTISHNLQAVPELIIVRRRDVGASWYVYSASLANTQYLDLSSTAGPATGATVWNSTTATSTVFSLGTSSSINSASGNFVSYLFASCSGVSKVGTYTGTGATQTISCGFAGGARFVLIKRSDGSGAWYIWDTARGMVSGTDPSIRLDSLASEVNADSVYTTTGGFQIVSTAVAINSSGLTYIYLAIA